MWGVLVVGVGPYGLGPVNRVWSLNPAMLGQAMIADRARLRARWIGLERGVRAGREPDAGAIAGIREDFERSADFRAAREENRPRPVFEGRANLPILEHRERIAEAIRANQVTVICGETGSGKTTQLPQICLDLGLGIAGMIGHTQPRRIAARTLASRIADELRIAADSRAVGYKVRFGDETNERTFIKVMTDGILLAETQGDRLLEAYDTIIIDEAHERSLNIDFLMGYLRQLLPKRPDLKVIITSATIDPERFSRHFGDAPIISVSGRLFPVEVRYRPIDDGRERDEQPEPRDQQQAILDAIDELIIGDSRMGPSGRGDVLVFLAGEREIRETAEALRKHHPPQTEILPLFARLSPQEQQRVFQPHPGRRIVLATNVAETSLTVPGIRYVVDAGRARMSRYNHRSKIQRLPIEAISRASANQRSGRCGRVQAGVCVRLYSEQDFAARPEFTEPEILRTNLASVILQMMGLHLGKVEDFPFVEPPDSRMIKDGYETLHELGAITEENELTDIGRALAKLPVDPRVGRMLLASDKEGCVAEMLILAAAMSVQDPRERPQAVQDQADLAHKQFADPESDFLWFLNVWRSYKEQERHLSGNKMRSWCRDHFLNWMRMREWEDVYSQLKEMASEIGLQAPRRGDAVASYEQLHRALLTGLLANVGTRVESFEYSGARGNKFNIWPGSSLFKKGPKWLAAVELVETTRRYARTACKIEPEWCEQLGGHVIKKSYSDPHWQKETGSVCAFERVTLFGLVLAPRRRCQYGPVDPVDARVIFIQHALVEGEYAWQGPFWEHNSGVIEGVRDLEAKLRKGDILAEKKAIYEFYDRRVPKEAHSVSTFEHWRKDAEETQPTVLLMSPKDVMTRDATEVTAEAFPDQVEAFGTRLSLAYKLDPGAGDDGVTLDVPIETLNQLDPDRCEWLVPGMLREKITGLMRQLPKTMRAQLQIPTLAETLAAALPFGQGRLAEALSQGVLKLVDVPIPVDAWQFKGLQDHLRFNIRVLGERGELLGSGREPAELKQRYAAHARKKLEQLARRSFGREGLTAWDFEDLPERFETTRNGQKLLGYPALVDHGETVALTLQNTQAEAEHATYFGTRRLFALAAQSEIDHHLTAQKNRQRLALLHGPIGTPAELMSGLRALVAERVFMAASGGVVIRKQTEFETRLHERWGKIGLTARDVATLAEQILDLRQRVALRLERPVGADWKDNAEDLRQQLALLTPKGFLGSVADERLRDYPRYLEGMSVRLNKLGNGNERRDTRELNAIRPLWRRYWHAVQNAGDVQAHRADPRALAQHRWLLEELRVSLFAERLGTRETVSAKRLNDHWDSLGLGAP